MNETKQIIESFRLYISSIVGGCNLALLRTSCREQTKGEGSQEGGARAEAAGEY